MDLSQRLRLWADELHAIANEGLHWSGDNPYNIRRFERVRRIAAELFAAPDAGDADAVEQLYRDHSMHITPFSGAEAAIFNQRGELLLIQRTDDRLWALPGGALEVGETPAGGACREAWEETGVEVEPLALIGVYDSRLCGSRGNSHLYHFVFLCRPRDMSAQPIITNETLDVRWFVEAELPPLSPGHHVRVPETFGFWRGERRAAVFDQV